MTKRYHKLSVIFDLHTLVIKYRLYAENIVNIYCFITYELLGAPTVENHQQDGQKPTKRQKC